MTFTYIPQATGVFFGAVGFYTALNQEKSACKDRNDKMIQISKNLGLANYLPEFEEGKIFASAVSVVGTGMIFAGTGIFLGKISVVALSFLSCAVLP